MIDDNEDLVADFVNELCEGNEEQLAKRNAIVVKQDLTSKEDQEAFLFNELQDIMGRTKKNLDVFEARIDQGDVFEGTIQGLTSMMGELGKTVGHFSKLKLEREKQDHQTKMLETKIKHEKEENDKKIKAKLESGPAGTLTQNNTSNVIMVGDAQGFIGNEDFQDIVSQLKAAKNESPVIEVEVIDEKLKMIDESAET